jgi:hypothetical protein
VADIPSPVKPPADLDRTVKLEATVDGLRYALLLDKHPVVAGEPVRGRLRVTDGAGKPFAQLEHVHPLAALPPLADARGGPELPFQLYVIEPGFYRFFTQFRSRARRSIRRSASTWSPRPAAVDASPLGSNLPLRIFSLRSAPLFTNAPLPPTLSLPNLAARILRRRAGSATRRRCSRYGRLAARGSRTGWWCAIARSTPRPWPPDRRAVRRTP